VNNEFHLKRVLPLFFFLMGLSPSQGSFALADGVLPDETGYGWFQTFEDEFEDADTAILRGANPGCFTQRAKCLKQYWADQECDPAFDSNLANLNKCNWRVYDYYNYMDLDAKAGVDAINAFHPSQVKVENGTLRLSANRSPYSRSELDCKNDYFEPLSGTMEHTKKCPIFSGGIEARPFQTTRGVDGGFQQAYGRFEVRARVPFGPGAWPAFWLLPHQAYVEPSSCGWPYAGEIDILETYAKSPGVEHGGIVSGACSENIQTNWGETWSPRGWDRAREMSENYHVYGVEWTDRSVKFFVDNEYFGSLYEGDLIPARKDGKRIGEYPARIPKGLFYWILNLSVARGAGDSAATRPDIDHFEEQNLIIDSVRTYRRCTAQDSKEKCKHFPMQDAGNSSRGETAHAEVNAYPNPLVRGANAGLRVTSLQPCQNFQVSITDANGQPIQQVYSGRMNENETRTWQISTLGWASGMYQARASFSGCGADQSGSGNQVFKMVVIE